MDLERELGDPGAWRRILDRFFVVRCDGEHRFEGTVDKFTGDGIMAIFGAPIAHEDQARRSSHKALISRRSSPPRRRSCAAPRARLSSVAVHIGQLHP